MTKKLIAKYNWLILSLLVGLASALSVGFVFVPHTLNADTAVNVNLFYGDGCPHCEKVKPVIEDLKEKYLQVHFDNYEIYHNQSNALFLYDLYEKNNVPDSDRAGVPIVFINNEYLIGDKPIIDNLEDKIVALLLSTNSETFLDNNVADIDQSNVLTKSKYSLWAIAGAAIVDSINPCAIAVLLILLTALMLGAGDKKKALYGGLAFTTSIYITYFLFGLGLLQIIALTNIAGIIAKLIGIVALIIGIANIKDFFFYGGAGFVMEIPRKWRPTLKRILNKATSPMGAFLVGFVVTLFELPCTGGPYFFVIGLLSQSNSIVDIIPTLLFYNVVFILPLLVIVFVVYFGVSSIEKAEIWKEKNIRFLHLVEGIIMLILGLWVFFN